MAAHLSRKSVNNESGQAMAEFVIIAITMMFTILGVLQLALVLNAYTLVRYAAYNAARSAIVHGGNQDRMDEAARLSLLGTFPSHGRADTPRGFMENYEGAKATDSLTTLAFFGDPITKVEIVHKEGIGCGQVVTFDDPVDTPDATVTVKVTHYYEMVIPLVNRMLFYVYSQIRSGVGYQNETVNQVAGITDGKRRTGNFRDIEYRIPLIAAYTMKLQSDFTPPGCS